MELSRKPDIIKLLQKGECVLTIEGHVRPIRATLNHVLINNVYPSDKGHFTPRLDVGYRTPYFDLGAIAWRSIHTTAIIDVRETNAD